MEGIQSVLPQGFDPESPEQVRCFYEDLLSESIDSLESLVWLITRFNAVQLLLASRRDEKIVNMSINTHDRAWAYTYNTFLNGAYAVKMNMENSIYDKILGSTFAGQLPVERYGHFLFVVGQNRKIACPNNVDLLIEEQMLSSRHGAICGTIRVEFDGKMLALPQIMELLSVDDETVRRRIWEAYYRAVEEKKDELDALFDRLIALRVRIAQNAGYSFYCDYMSVVRQKHGYSNADVVEFSQCVKSSIMPMLRKFNRNRAALMGKSKMMPWDGGLGSKVTSLPYCGSEAFIHAADTVFGEIDQEFHEWFMYMAEHGNLDLESRPGKAPSLFCAGLPEHRSAFVFTNCTRTTDDIRMLAHECGHAFHIFSMLKADATLAYDFVPGDVAELASQVMEFITMDSWDQCVEGAAYMRQAKSAHLYKVLTIIKQSVAADEFQRWIYQNPNHSPEQRTNKYLSLLEEYDDGICYEGYSRQRALSWYMLPHYFILPFYFLEYAIAYFGALAIYKNYKQDKEGTMSAYKNFLSGGFDRSPGDAYRTAGIELNLTSGYCKDIISFLEHEIEMLG